MDLITIILIVAFVLVAIGVLAAILSFKKNQKETTMYFSLADTIPAKKEEPVKENMEEKEELKSLEIPVEYGIVTKEGDEDSKPANKFKKGKAKKPKKDSGSKLNPVIRKKAE